MALVRRYNPTPAPTPVRVNECECRECGQPLTLNPTAVDEALKKATAAVPSVTRGQIFGKSREKLIVQARRIVIHELHYTKGWHPNRIAQILDMDRSSALYHLGKTKKSSSKHRLAA